MSLGLFSFWYLRGDLTVYWFVEWELVVNQQFLDPSCGLLPRKFPSLSKMSVRSVLTNPLLVQWTLVNRDEIDIICSLTELEFGLNISNRTAERYYGSRFSFSVLVVFTQ